MKLTVLLFAAARDAVGQTRLEVELSESATVAELKQRLADQFASLQPLLPHLLVAVDNHYVSDDAPLSPGVEVACFPPVSGG